MGQSGREPMSRHQTLRITLFIAICSGLAVLFGHGRPLLAQSAPAPYDWLQMNGNPQHSGNNTQEAVLGPANVASLQLFFQATLPADADGAPVALSAVATPSGTRN